MNHILQSVIVEQPHTLPFRIVLHKLHGVKLCTHMEVLERVANFANPSERIHKHNGYCHGHYHDSEVDALCDFAIRCKDVNAKLEQL